MSTPAHDVYTCSGATEEHTRPAMKGGHDGHQIQDISIVDRDIRPTEPREEDMIEERLNFKEMGRRELHTRPTPREEVEEPDEEIPPAAEAETLALVKEGAAQKDAGEDEGEEEQEKVHMEEEGQEEEGDGAEGDEEEKEDDDDKEDEDEEEDEEEKEDDEDEEGGSHLMIDTNRTAGTVSGIEAEFNQIGRTNNRKRCLWEHDENRRPKRPRTIHNKNDSRKAPKIKPKKLRNRKCKTLRDSGSGVQVDEIQQWPGPVPTDMDADSKEWYVDDAIITLDIDETPAKIEEQEEWRMADATGTWHRYKPVVHVSISLSFFFFTEYSLTAYAHDGITQSFEGDY